MQDLKSLQRSLKKTDRHFSLPPNRIIFRETGEENGWASAYGGIIELANYAKLKGFLSCPFNAMWQHGVLPDLLYRAYPQALTYGLIEDLGKQVFVANDDQKECLQRFGFTNVHAIGLPFAYAKPSKLPDRKPGTVLWMPPHSLPGEKEDWSNKTEESVGWFIQKYGGSHRQDVYTCLHNSCINNELWWPELLRNGIPIIRGGSHHDGNSYKRMWLLLSQIDVVSTNSISSHVFYALAAGCKVRIEGPYVGPSFNEKLISTPYYQRLISQGAQLDSIISAFNRSAASYRALLGEESYDRQLGEKTIGIPNKLSPLEIREVLGWTERSQLASTARHGIKSFAKTAAGCAKTLITKPGHM